MSLAVPLKRTRRPVAWLLVLVLLASASWPALARALGQDAARTVWAEICTAQGRKLVLVDDGAGPDPAPLSASGALDHCPWCLLQAHDALAPPPAAPVQGVPAGEPGLAPEPAPGVLPAPAAWPAALPRAPPPVLD